MFLLHLWSIFFSFENIFSVSWSQWKIKCNLQKYVIYQIDHNKQTDLAIDPISHTDQHCDLGGSFVGTLGFCPVEPLLSCRGRSWGSLQISTLPRPPPEDWCGQSSGFWTHLASEPAPASLAPHRWVLKWERALGLFKKMGDSTRRQWNQPWLVFPEEVRQECALGTLYFSWSNMW